MEIFYVTVLLLRAHIQTHHTGCSKTKYIIFSKVLNQTWNDKSITGIVNHVSYSAPTARTLFILQAVSVQGKKTSTIILLWCCDKCSSDLLGILRRIQQSSVINTNQNVPGQLALLVTPSYTKKLFTFPKNYTDEKLDHNVIYVHAYDKPSLKQEKTCRHITLWSQNGPLQLSAN
jgi:hypothetical protein